VRATGNVLFCIPAMRTESVRYIPSLILVRPDARRSMGWCEERAEGWPGVGLVTLSGGLSAKST
jgi:hypothetical protein